MAELTGQVIGKYLVKEELGRGGMGQVFKAIHPVLQREVAIKLLHTHLSDKTAVVERFYREAKIVAGLRHSNIVQVYDFDTIEDSFYLVMEYVEGETLRDHLEHLHHQGERMPIQKAMEIFSLIARAVAYAHQNGVIHRDLKPANVLLDSKEQPILADFGLSKILWEEGITLTGQFFGTPHYMSPEQSSGKESDERSDIYSLGVMLYEITVGAMPYSGDTPMEIILKHINEEPVPPRSINPDLPEPVNRIIEKALAKDPDRRYQNGQELVQDIAALLMSHSPAETILSTQFASLDDSSCPYRGLQMFEAEHAQFYYGREAQVDQLARWVEKLVHPPGQAGKFLPRFISVIGASGSGKSSLVLAGLIPALQEGEVTGSKDWPIITLRPGKQPLEELATKIAPLVSSQENILEATRKLIDNLAEDGRTLHLATRIAWADAPAEKHLFLVIDQFEEVFTLCKSKTEQQKFIENIIYASTVTDGRVIIVLTMRADFYHRAAPYRNLAELISSQQMLVGVMDEAELRRAIERPANKVGLRIQPGLVDMILADISRQPGALPLLQHTLLELWNRRAGGMLTIEAYRESGGIRGAIAQRADTIYNNFDENEQEIVSRIMLRLTELNEGNEPTRRRAERAELIFRQEDEEAVESVLSTMADARLITIGGETVEVAHEALIREWPRLQTWLDENREGLRLSRHLAAASKEWESLDRDAGELYRGARLQAASEWAMENDVELNPLEREFLEASRAFAEQLEREKEAKRQQELKQARALAEAHRKQAEVQTKSSRRLRIFASGLFLLLLLACAAIWLVINQQKTLDVQRLTFAAQSQLKASPEKALLLSYEAVVRGGDYKSEQILRDAISEYSWQSVELKGHNEMVISAKWSRDSRKILTISSDGAVILWTPDGKLHKPIEITDQKLTHAEFSIDGKTIFTAAEDGTVRSIDMETDQTILFEGHSGQVIKLIPGLQNECILTASADGTAKLWNLKGNLVRSFGKEGRNIVSAALSNDSKKIAIGDGDGTASVWFMDGRSPKTFSGHTNEILDVAFSPDGNKLVTGSRDKTARIWEIGNSQSVILEHTEKVEKVMFTPNSEFILTSAGRENTVRKWTPDGRHVVSFHGHEKNIASMEMSDDCQSLLTASGDGTARIWNLSGVQMNELKGHTGIVTHATFSPDEKHILTSSEDGTARIWQPINHYFTEVLQGHNNEVERTVFSNDGKYLLTSSNDKTARLWNNNGETITIFEGHTDEVEIAIFSPDGKRILTGSEDHTARLWNLQGEELAVFRHNQEITAASFNPSGNLVITCSDDSTTKIWNLDGTPKLSLTDHRNELQSALFSPDGEFILTTSEDSSAILWDADGRHITQVRSNGKMQEGIFHPHQDLFLTASYDHTAALWDYDGNKVAEFLGHQAKVLYIAFNPAGDRVLTTSSDYTAKLWSLKGKLLQNYVGHTNVIKWASFSPDGQLIVTASDDGTARLWDLQGNLHAKFSGHGNWVATAVFSPDGKRVVTASRDNTARIFLVDKDDLLQIAACSLGRELSAEEMTLFDINESSLDLKSRVCPPVFSWEK